MNNTNNKETAKLKNILVIMVATCVVIGLLSSTAIRLVTATFLMQSSKNVNTGNEAVDSFLNDVLAPVAPSAPSTPSTPSAPSAPSAPSEPEAPAAPDAGESDPVEDSGSEDSGGDLLSGIIGFIGSLFGGSGESGSEDAGETEVAPTPEEILAANKTAVKSYVDVLTESKYLPASRPGFTKTVDRDLSLDTITSIFQGGIAEKEGVVEYLEDKSVVVNKGDETDELCIKNIKSACLLTVDDATIQAAVKSSSKQVVKMGYVENIKTGEVVHGYDIIDDVKTYRFEYSEEEYADYQEVSAVKIVITFNDEVNPAPIDENGKTDSFIASVFPVVTGEQVRVAIDNTGATTIDVTYTNCSVEMYYESESGEIISLTQNVNYNVTVKDGRLTLNGSVSEVAKYSDFVY